MMAIASNSQNQIDQKRVRSIKSGARLRSVMILSFGFLLVLVNPAASTCPHTKAAYSRTVINCPAAPKTDGGCVKTSWFNATTGLPFAAICAVEQDGRCWADGPTRYYNAVEEWMTCDLFGTNCGYVWKTVHKYNLGPIQQRYWEVCSILE